MPAHNFIDLSGQLFGRLTVLAQADRLVPKVPLWHCRCECGNSAVVEGKNLRGGLTTSCGCLRAEATKTRATTHGRTNSAEYKTWCGIKRRCYNAADARFSDYGGRGIQMSEAWRGSFADFYADMGPRPSALHSIERLDHNGHYDKANCVWLENRLQNKNRRDNVLMTHVGKTQILADWARETGLGISTIQARIRRGWSVSKALSEPLDLAKQYPRTVSVAVKPRP